MNRELLLKKLKEGNRVYGTCVTATSPIWTTTIAKTGVDFVFIDTEHIPLDRAALAALCQHYQALNVTPIVRIASPDPYLACQAIDGGAIGIVAPYLENSDQFKTLIGAIKYRPLKGEKLEAILNGETPLDSSLDAYIQNYNRGNLFIANIESVPALGRLEELLSEPGVDGVFIGPHDLSVSMGLPEQYDHPEFEAAVRQIIQITRSKGKHIGIHFSLEPERQIKWIQEGVNMVVHSFDIALFKQKLIADIVCIQSAVGDVVASSAEAELVI
jgi:2-keto-3-deoxy-L-rhamnonate aldolase RhmA